MLAKKNRLGGSREYDSLFRKGGFVQNDLLILRWLANNREFSRFGFVVSSKVSKKATKRNLVKRRLSGIVEAEQEQWQQGFDLVIIAKAEIVDKGFEEIKKAVKELLGKAGLV